MSRDAVIETDFVITVAGRDVTHDVLDWEAIESEAKMSRVACTISNEEEKNDGLGNTGDKLSIRFGEDGNLDPAIQFPIMEDKGPHMSDGYLTIWLCGYDETSKASGGKNKGNFDKDMTAREISEQISKSLGLTLEGDSDGPKLKDQPFGVHNEKWWQVLYRLKKQMKVKSGKGKAPSSVFPKEGGGKPDQFHGETDLGDSGSAVGRTFLPPDVAKELDQNFAGNNAASAAGSPVTATLKLRGFPSLRTGKCITVLKVGSKYSGKWYAEEIKRSWRKGSGAATECSLIRGGTGKGCAGDTGPNVFYAKIFEKKGTLFMGQRDLDGESQATFTYGDGQRVISFEPHTQPQKERGGGEPKKGKVEGVDLLNLGEPYEEKAHDEAGAGG